MFATWEWPPPRTVRSGRPNRILERYLEQVWPLANDYLAAGERIVEV